MTHCSLTEVYLNEVPVRNIHKPLCLFWFLQVDYVEPWLAGNARGPSTAFCLLFRLFELKPTEEEVQQTINHEDSAYIRAVRPSHLCCSSLNAFNMLLQSMAVGAV